MYTPCPPGQHSLLITIRSAVTHMCSPDVPGGGLPWDTARTVSAIAVLAILVSFIAWLAWASWAERGIEATR